MIFEKRRHTPLTIKEIAVFAMLGTLMYLGDILMEWAPNIHFVGALTIIYTLVYRTKALIPIYIYVFLNGLYAGFSMWWVPYLYIWTILWGLTMLVPRRLNFVLAAAIYSALCALHGFAYGALYAPAQAIMFGLDFDAMVAWIISGLTFDFIHGIGNLAASVIIMPMTEVLCRLEHKQRPYRIRKQ